MKYKLEVSMNNEVYETDTEDIKTALLELAPKVFKTKVVIRVSNKHSVVEKVMMIQRAKMLFRNTLNMDIFVKNILLALKDK